MRNPGSWWSPLLLRGAIYNGTMLTLIQDKDQMHPFTNFQGKVTRSVLGTRAFLTSVPIFSSRPPFSRIRFTLPASGGQAERPLPRLLPLTKTRI